MEKYVIAYVDESNEDIRSFQRYASSDFDVIPYKPIADIHEMVSILMDTQAKAIISDFKLNEYDNVASYDGVDLVNEYLKIRPNYPCFVLTSYDDMAADESSDVNIVYTKSVIHEHSKGIPFIERVRKQIIHYEARLVSAQKELDVLLIKLKENTINAAEVDRMVELDTFIERSINAPSSIPKEIKMPSNAAKLNELIDSTKDLLRELKVHVHEKN